MDDGACGGSTWGRGVPRLRLAGWVVWLTAWIAVPTGVQGGESRRRLCPCIDIGVVLSRGPTGVVGCGSVCRRGARVRGSRVICGAMERVLRPWLDQGWTRAGGPWALRRAGGS